MRWGPVSEVGRVRLRLAAPPLDAPHRARPHARGAEVRRRTGTSRITGCRPRWSRTRSCPSFRWLYRTAQVARRREGRGGRRWRTAPRSAALFTREGGPAAPALPEPRGPRLLARDGRDAGPRREEPAGALRQGRRLEGQDAHGDRADRGAARAGRVHPEARHQPGGLARRLRAADAVGRASWRSRAPGSRRRAARRSTTGAASAATGRTATATARPRRSSTPRPRDFRLGVVQVPHDAVGLAADGRRPLSARSRAACAGRRCPRGTSCPRRTGSR